MELENLLKQRGIVLQSPSREEIIKRAKEIHPNKLRIMYGETYDECGEPIDCLKHYFFVANLSEALSRAGIENEPTILIADVAVSHNETTIPYEEVMAMGKRRANFVKRVNEIYATNLKVLMMSDFIYGADFAEKVKKIKEVCLREPELYALIEKTVPEDKVAIERKKDFQYSLEEIATIIDFDIKVGPPRETVYDRIAIKIAEKSNAKALMPIYLTPSYPLGLGFDYFLSNPEIESQGITAYKVDSKGLRKNRVVIGKTSLDELKCLANNSYIPDRDFQDLPNPLLDLLLLSEVAGKRLCGGASGIPPHFEDFYTGKLTDDSLRELMPSQVDAHILSKLKDYQNA